MKISSEHSAADAKEKRRQGELGFTMVEIAMAIGIIGFALVAIIGIIPSGMNVQQNNREETLISQDAPYFLDALRDGFVLNTNRFGYANQNLDILTNYVESVTPVSNYLNPAGVLTNVLLYPNPFTNLSSGWEMIGLLLTPAWQNTFYSGYVSTVAIVRSLSGSAVQQNGSGFPAANGNPATAFWYQMTVEVVPFNTFSPDTTNWVYYANLLNPDTNQVMIRSNRWWLATTTPLSYNLFDIQLHFSWPIIGWPNLDPRTVKVGPNRRTYRSVLAAQLLETNAFVDGGQVPVWFFQPNSFLNLLTTNL